MRTGGDEASADFIAMNGRAVARFATSVLVDVLARALASCGLRAGDLDLLIPHQANARLIESATRKLDLPPEKVFINIQRYGNTSAASIPIAWCDAVEEGRLRPGDRVAMAGFGAGLTWGVVLLEWEPAAGKRGVDPPVGRNGHAVIRPINHRHLPVENLSEETGHARTV
jgi:3-oxoacyl-[acyl-carrier-protein] synthase III